MKWIGQFIIFPFNTKFNVNELFNFKMWMCYAVWVYSDLYMHIDKKSVLFVFLEIGNCIQMILKSVYDFKIIVKCALS